MVGNQQPSRERIKIVDDKAHFSKDKVPKNDILNEVKNLRI